MNLTRRSFLGWGTTLAVGAQVPFAVLYSRSARAESFGPLVGDPNDVLDLPAGFSYHLLQSSGDTMSDGNNARGAPDGMACFPGESPGQVILMRNHELSGGNGGVSRLVIDLSDASAPVVVSSNDVLTGTSRNCAGGPSPWGWLTCEEDGGGGVWVCPEHTSSLLTGENRVRVDDYGSFRHEAVAIDPETLIAYLTEDDGDSFFYRMVPANAAEDPFSGQLQAMKRVGMNDFNTENMNPGDSFDIEWADVEPATARSDAQDAEATIVVRGEGVWWFDGAVYFSATSNDQIFELVPNEANTGGTLRLVANDNMNAPDNITVAPWGDVFVAEDNGSANYIRIVDAEGAVADFCRNVENPSSEFAGVCFSPDGQVLFVNIQGSGLTFAITGPFPQIVVNPGTGGSDGMGSGGDSAVGGTTSSGGESAMGGATSGGSEGMNTAGGRAGVGTGGSDGGGAGTGGGAGRGDGANQGTGTGDDGGCACTLQAGMTSSLGPALVSIGAGAVALARRRGRASLAAEDNRAAEDDRAVEDDRAGEQLSEGASLRSSPPSPSPHSTHS